ncbi:MAG: SPOR domain-containing protein [Proteobacteria bacterium]|nr:MAG: SPOR domain-containing protein [Pseudomonadota bacterium]
MSEKPALYVVEKKEVVILVILFVLVTVLAFTMGVRYGESVGKKSALLQASAAGEHGEAGDATGGTLGDTDDEATSSHGEHGKDTKEASGHGKDTGHGKEASHGKEAAGHGDAEAPKAAPKAVENAAPGREAADKNSDEFLLNALKEAGVEPPGGKAPNDAELPSDVKKAKSGTYVIQVGSHPTKNEAMSQIRSLSAKKVEASVLAPFKDRQGEWHRVVIGSFKTKRDAEREANQLKAKNAILSYFVWRLP